MPTFKVIAHTSEDHGYGYSVLISVSSNDLRTLMRYKEPNRVPKVGTELDFTETFERLKKLEEREATADSFSKMIADLLPKPPTPREEGNG